MFLRKIAAPLRLTAVKYNHIQKDYSTSSSAPSPIYELRVYRPYPKDFKATLDLFTKNIGLRQKHSKLFGFWTAEIGDEIFELVHLWEYESLSHRRNVRNNMLQDEEWKTQMLPDLMPKLMIMSNALVTPAPNTQVNVDFTNDPKAVYELQAIEREDVEPDSMTNTAEGETLVGNFWGIYGDTETAYRLWRYTDIDGALGAAWKRAQESPQEGRSMLLYPAGFSPIQ